MAEPETVTHLHRAIPTVLEVDRVELESFSPNELRAIEQMTGRPVGDVMGSDKAMDYDQIQAVMWVALRRQGFDPTWDEAGDCRPRFLTPAAPDPTSGGA